MFIEASVPPPNRKSPIDVMMRFWLKSIRIQPMDAIPQANIIVILLPKLSEKKEKSTYPTNAPTYTDEDPISIYISS